MNSKLDRAPATDGIGKNTLGTPVAHSEGFLADVLRGLTRRPRSIPARWFYDRRGSELFDEITRLDEYYQTRSEQALLSGAAAAIASLVGEGRVVVEFGAGSLVKTPTVLRAVAPAAYIPIDISGEHIHASCLSLSAEFPGLPVLPFVADFSRPITLEHACQSQRRLGLFFGSTIGNLDEPEALQLLGEMRRTLGDSSMLLIGLDLVKPADTLRAAYNDRKGVTAAFNLNLLTRINRELRGNIVVESFQHRAIWNAAQSRIEMHLVASGDCSFQIAGCSFSLSKGESIHTENSYKYEPDEARALLSAGGWTPISTWSDRQFLLILAAA